MRTALLISGFLSLLFSSVGNVTATRLDTAAYPFPYRNPYMATMTVPLMKGREAEGDQRILDLQLEVLKGRNGVPLLEGKGKLRYRFYRQPGLAPLIFIIPGFGSSAYAGSARYMAEWLADKGFHVLVLPSPFHWNFCLAASHSGFPGVSRADAQDLYAVMQSALLEVRERYGAAIGAIGVMGWSHGALGTAYLSQLDRVRKRIGIDTFLLINPPVDLLGAVEKLDAMAMEANRLSPERRDYLEDYAAGVLRKAYRQGNVDDPGYFTGLNRQLRLSDEQIRYLIGRQLQIVAGDCMYVIELAQHPGILKTPIDWGSRSGRFEEARSIGLSGYVERFLLPHLRRSGQRGLNLERLNAQMSIKAVGPALHENSRVHLMHNLDDFLVSADEIAYLEGVFGGRALIYPHGGHLGNLWYARNRQEILAVFQPLLKPSPRHSMELGR